MSAGVESGQSKSMGAEAGEQKLLSRLRKWRASEAMAEGASGLLAQKEIWEERYVTRDLP